jgi:nucleoside-diphosphate-sugar epimerase
MVFLITGGAGFLGKAIVEELLSDWAPDQIRVLDLREPEAKWLDKIIFIKGDIRDSSIVSAACNGVDMVIHSAAIIDWGTKTEKEVLDINAGGTEIIIDACRENDVPFLIYTSSLDAVFNGKSMEGIDENVAYPDKPINAYCDSKQKAEALVKKSNSGQLKTCILRPADIFGEGDPYHIGSLIDMAKGGFYVRLGNGKSVCQHVYVRNMAYAHILVARAFIERNKAIEGNVYFITDGPPHNFFKFYDKVVSGAGYKIWPGNLWLPFWLAYGIGSIIEFAAWLISPIKKINPKFSRFAVVYTCSNFTFNSNRAKKDFGYTPKYPTSVALSKTIEHYRKTRNIS